MCILLHLQIITALRREWAAIPQNDIRIIIGLIRRRCTACMVGGGGGGAGEAMHLIKHSVTFKNAPSPVSFTIHKKVF